MRVMFPRKIKKPIPKFKFFFLFFCFFCVQFFSFVILTIIRTRKQQRAHFNNASNVNKIITMISWRNQKMIPY